MHDRRRSTRMDLQVTLLLREVGKSASQGVINVEVFDISQGGIGFNCDFALSTGTTYEADIHIWTGDIIHAFVEVIRCMKSDDGRFKCGGVFIGMPEADWCRIRVYETYQKFTP